MRLKLDKNSGFFSLRYTMAFKILVPQDIQIDLFLGQLRSKCSEKCTGK